MESNDKEKLKIFLYPGDIVKLKGIESTTPEMKVKEMVWETSEDGKIIYDEEGKRTLKGVLVYWINDRSDYIERIFNTRALYKVEKEASYHLAEAVKILSKLGRTDVVSEIKKVLLTLAEN